jgi:hypothetical protein
LERNVNRRAGTEYPRALVACILASSLFPAPAGAQSPIAAIKGVPTAGSCRIVVAVPAGMPAATVVELALNSHFVARQQTDGRTELTFLLSAPVQHLDTVRVRDISGNRVGDWGPNITVAEGNGASECRSTPVDEDETVLEEREPFWATAYLGMAVDNFAPAEVGNYKNPTAGGSAAREVVGVDFEFRAWGKASGKRQLWIIGQTLHGMRSADVDCTGETRPPVCESLASTTNPSERFLYVLEHANSFEGYLAFRYEFATLQAGTAFPSRLYLTGRFGVMMLDDEVHDAYDTHHFGVGLMAPASSFAGSYLEVGIGRSDLFFSEPGRRPYHRLKIDGMLSFPVLKKIWEGAPNAFVQLYADFDPTGGGADSVQSFFGFEFELSELFK